MQSLHRAQLAQSQDEDGSLIEEIDNLPVVKTVNTAEEEFVVKIKVPRLGQLEHELEESRKRNTQLTTNNKQLETKLAAKKKRVTALNELVGKQRVQLKRKSMKISFLIAQRNGLKADVSSMKQDKKALTTQVEDMSNLVKTKNNKLLVVRKKLLKKATAKKELQDKVDAKKAKNKELQVKLVAKAATKEDLKAKLVLKNTKTRELRGKLGNMRRAKAEDTEEARAFNAIRTAEMKDIVEELSNVEKGFASVTGDLASLENDHVLLTRQFNDTQSDLQDAQGELQVAQGDLDTLAGELKEASTQTKEQQGELDALKIELAENKGLLEISQDKLDQISKIFA